MEKQQIKYELEKTTRWGNNFMCDLEYAEEIFITLPVKRIEVKEEDTIIVEFHHPLNQKEVFSFISLGFDEPCDCEPDQTVFTLWWD